MSSGPGYTTAAIGLNEQSRLVGSPVLYSDLISELLFEVDPQTIAISLTAPATMALGAVDGLHKASVVGGYAALIAGFFATGAILLHLFA